MADKLMKSMMETYKNIQNGSDEQDRLDEAASQNLNKALLTKAFVSMGFSEKDAEKVTVLTPAQMRKKLKEILQGGGMNDFATEIRGGCKGMPKGRLAALLMIVANMMGTKVGEDTDAAAVKTDVDAEKLAKDVEEEE